jgi:predicted transcriptional regulator of viral defense system
MKSIQVLRELGDLTAGQWGMVTTAQAATRGISRLHLSRLADDGQLERIGHGIYRDAGAPPEQFDGLKAAWLSVNPKQTAYERTQSRPTDAVVSGPAASYLLGLGDLVPEPYQFTVPARRQTQRDSLAFRVRWLPPGSVTIREGLPVTTPEQTIADLIDERQDRSLVADVFAEAESVDVDALTALLGPLSQRNGFARGDGAAFYADLERLAHRDLDSLARAMSTTVLGKKITEEYMRLAGLPDLSAITGPLNAQIAQVEAQIMASPGMQELAKVSESIAAQIAETVAAQATEALSPAVEAIREMAAEALRPATEAIRELASEALTGPAQTLTPRASRQLIDAVTRLRSATATSTTHDPYNDDEVA